MNVSRGTFKNYLQNSGTAEISGGTFETSNYVLYNYSGATLNISDGMFKSTSTQTKGYRCLKNYGTANLTGGDYMSNKSECIYNYSGGTLNVSGGNYMSSGGAGLINDGTTEISGIYGRLFEGEGENRESIRNNGTLNIYAKLIVANSYIGIYNSSGAKIYISSSYAIVSPGPLTNLGICNYTIYNFGSVTNMREIDNAYYYAYYNVDNGEVRGPASSVITGNHN